MKKGKLSEAQIIAMLNEGEAGVPIADLCRKYQVSSATYYNLKAKYAGMAVSDLRRLKALEDGNRKRRKLMDSIRTEYKIGVCMANRLCALVPRLIIISRSRKPMMKKSKYYFVNWQQNIHAGDLTK